MELNDLIIEYQQTKDEDVFYNIYMIVHSNSNLVEMYAGRYHLDESDVESMINEKLLDLVWMYDRSRGNFVNLLNYVIKNGCIDLTRRKQYEESNRQDVMIEDDDGELNELYEIVEVETTTDEDDIVTEIRKKLDQRQLIQSLIQKADEPTKATISAFLSTTTYRQAAKALNVACHKTIKARIRRLSTAFDQKGFGNYQDYLIEPTRYVG